MSKTVICIASAEAKNGREFTYAITIGKFYAVLESKFMSGYGDKPMYKYKLLNDEGYELYYPSNMFITLQEHRERVLNKIL